MAFLSRRTPAPVDISPMPFHPSSPEGLAARWVQWVAAAPFMRSPIEDETGEHAGIGQPGDVWFLAGSFGTVRRRRCIVPPGVPLFVPVVNQWFAPELDDGGPLEVAGEISVDGADLEPEEIRTPVPFLVTGSRLNGVTGTKRPVALMVHGLWKQLPPLPPGDHDVHVLGGDGAGFALDVLTRVTVAPSSSWVR